MKNKAIALAVASALIAPSAFAASDTSGMQYTSASEGFYGSLRARYVTSAKKDGGADIQSGSSRIGIGGTADLGGGLTGFYGWELGVALDDNSGNAGLDQRLGNVGLRGDFGQVVFGSFWTFDYSATHGSTDQANTHSGFFNYTLNREARSERSFQYTTPDFNGFQSALAFSFKNQVDGKGAKLVAQDPDPKKDENDLDAWNLAAQYAVQGFTLGGSYNVRPDALSKKVYTQSSGDAGVTSIGDNVGSVADAKSWTIRGSYAQDNWNVNAWYGQDNTSDRGNLGTDGSVVVRDDVEIPITALAGPGTRGETAANLQQRASEMAAEAARKANLARGIAAQTKAEDSTFLAFHAGVAVDKVNLYAIHEISENEAKLEDTFTTLGVQYNLGSQARTWLEYTAQDYASAPELEDYINIGLRFDF